MLPEHPNDTPPRGGGDRSIPAGILREIGLFGALGNETLEHLAHRLTTFRVGPGDVIFREEDETIREMFVLLEGEIEVSKRNRLGHDTRVAILGPYDWFGEMGMFDMQPRSATVRALAPSRLIRIQAADFDALYRFDLKSYALIVLNVARGLSRRLRVADGLLVDLAASAPQPWTAGPRA